MVNFLKRGAWLQVVCAVVITAWVHEQACSAEEAAPEPTTAPAVFQEELGLDELTRQEPIVKPHELLTCVPEPARVWTIDYRVKSFCSSHTSYEIGTPPSVLPDSWAPLSRLRFPLDSTWNGLEVGVERPNWGMHCEWLTPMGQHIGGVFADYDFTNPLDTTHLTDLGFARERWTDGQTIDFSLEYKLSDHFFRLPIEVWPMGGFRWQRFDLTAYDLNQVKYQDQWTSILVPGDVITFNQQYYMCYLGGQLRKTFSLTEEREVRVTFQGDWAATWGYHVDHHLLAPDFFAFQSTQGNSWHVALTAEVPMTRRLSLGVQADYLNIRTKGKTWEDKRSTEVWSNGVGSYSDQNSVTAFARLSY